ncbi:methyltransferase [Pseudohyphozyma bogoriensis]|nr:methyltransferase [Pseudohyphozyma bogoriensis]
MAQPHLVKVQELYDARAETYDDEDPSFHQTLSKDLIHLASPRWRQRVLVLCCGTGAEVLLAAACVGTEGQVVGVDVSTKSLDICRRKVEAKGLNEGQVRIVQGDVEDVELLKELEGGRGGFDAIICCSAFVLMSDMGTVLEKWKQVLKPATGVMVIDIITPSADPVGLILEATAEEMELKVFYHRLWATDAEAVAALFAQAGLAYKVTPTGTYGPTRTHQVDEWEQKWNSYQSVPLLGELVGLPPEKEEMAKAIFKRRWFETFGNEKLLSVAMNFWIVQARVPA